MDMELVVNHTVEGTLMADSRCLGLRWWPSYCVEDNEGGSEVSEGSGSNKSDPGLLILSRAEVWQCQAMGTDTRGKDNGIGTFGFRGLGVQVGKQHNGYEYECKGQELQTGQLSGGGFVHMVSNNDDLCGCCSYFDGGV